MIDKPILDILWEYEELVFQGYTTADIAYMGTCLQRWAIEQRSGPYNLKPSKDGNVKVL